MEEGIKEARKLLSKIINKSYLKLVDSKQNGIQIFHFYCNNQFATYVYDGKNIGEMCVNPVVRTLYQSLSREIRKHVNDDSISSYEIICELIKMKIHEDIVGTIQILIIEGKYS